MIVLIIGLMNRIYGLENLAPHKGKIIVNVVVSNVMIPLFIYINQALTNLAFGDIKAVT